MLDFILSNLYIIVIVGFAIFTAISSRSGKGQAQRRNPNGMPTFGGGPSDRNKGTDRRLNEQQNEDDAQRRYREAQQRYETPDTYEEGPSYETAAPVEQRTFESRESVENDRSDSRQSSSRSAEQYNSELQKRLDQLNRNLDQRADMNRSRAGEQRMTISDSLDSEFEHAASESAAYTVQKEQARQGVIWAEILGPPRSKQTQGRISTAYKK